MTGGCYTRPGISDYSTEDAKWRHDVEGASLVCEEVGHNPTENGSGVENREEIEAEIYIDDAVGNTVTGNVIKRNIHPHKAEECPDREQVERHLAKNFEIEERSPCGRIDLRSHDGDWYHQSA